jgi:hypothetical protein
MTVGQDNIWRVWVRHATYEAAKEKRPFSLLQNHRMFKMHVNNQVIRAIFCAKFDDIPFSKLPSDYFKR